MYIISSISILWNVQDVDESIFMQMTVWLAIVVWLVSLKTSVKKPWYTLHKRCFSMTRFYPLIRWFNCNCKSYVLCIPRSLFFCGLLIFLFLRRHLFFAVQTVFFQVFIVVNWFNVRFSESNAQLKVNRCQSFLILMRCERMPINKRLIKQCVKFANCQDHWRNWFSTEGILGEKFYLRKTELIILRWFIWLHISNFLYCSS